MIGNDVVDLHLAKKQSDWRRKGFLERVFTFSEKKFITSSGNADARVWLLWSMKEAAYKANQRKNFLSRRLNWKSQECEVLTIRERFASGLVRIGAETYFTRSEISEEVIYTSAVDREDRILKNGYFKTSSEEMKRQFLQQFSAFNTLNDETLEIRKNSQDVPFLFLHGTALPVPFSFTGHGRFHGFSFPLINC